MTPINYRDKTVTFKGTLIHAPSGLGILQILPASNSLKPLHKLHECLDSSVWQYLIIKYGELFWNKIP